MTSAPSQHLGLVDYLGAEAIGVPGKRTFNITARSDRGQAIVWMEKDQLFQVGISIKQFIATRESTADPVPFTPAGDAPSSPISAEFKSGEMSLQHDSGSDVFTLSALEPAEDGSDEPAREVLFSFIRPDAERLADAALKSVAAGRPPCPLCGAPMEDGGSHFCVKVNGHNRAARRRD